MADAAIEQEEAISASPSDAEALPAVIIRRETNAITLDSPVVAEAQPIASGSGDAVEYPILIERGDIYATPLYHRDDLTAAVLASQAARQEEQESDASPLTEVEHADAVAGAVADAKVVNKPAWIVVDDNPYKVDDSEIYLPRINVALPLSTEVEESRSGGLWARITGQAGRERRLSQLSSAIAEDPDAPANYVLRGELRLKAGDYEGAEADFERALILSRSKVQLSDWGLVAQVMQDRALFGLEAAHKQLMR